VLRGALSIRLRNIWQPGVWLENLFRGQGKAELCVHDGWFAMG